MLPRCLYRLSSLLLLVPLVNSQPFPVFNVDCARYPGPCNNNCYAIFVAGKPSNLNWDKPSKQTKVSRRNDAGCRRPNPCCGTMSRPSGQELSCDEYPYASSVEGGAGSIIRCTNVDENLNEGRALGGFLTSGNGCGNVQCTFTVMNINAGTTTPYCLGGGGANDGFEYTYTNGAYNLAKRDEESVHARHMPDPELFFPPEKRREFLLDNDKRALLVSRDEETSYIGENVVSAFPNGTTSVAKVVRELHGMEKSPELRPRHMRRAVEAPKSVPRSAPAPKSLPRSSVAASRLFNRQAPACACNPQIEGNAGSGTYCYCGTDGGSIVDCDIESEDNCDPAGFARPCTRCGIQSCCENGVQTCQGGDANGVCVDAGPVCNPDDPEGDPDGLGDPTT